ncbi:unnamed protein product, partial [Prorocentrum cordatum]
MLEAKLKPNSMSYNAGISACADVGQWQWALALLSQKWEAKLDPDSATALGSARARMASSGSGLCRFSVICRRSNWSPTPSLQRWNQRVRELRAVAAGFGTAQRD